MTKAKKAIVGIGTREEWFRRAIERNAKMDRGEKIAPEIRITFDNPADLLRALSAERVRVIQTVRLGSGKSLSLTALAAKLNRDRKAVSRDVTLLEALGLIRTHEQANPGHGKVKVVEPVAERYHLTATF